MSKVIDNEQDALVELLRKQLATLRDRQESQSMTANQLRQRAQQLSLCLHFVNMEALLVLLMLGVSQ